jgi:hypothetical protein
VHVQGTNSYFTKWHVCVLLRCVFKMYFQKFYVRSSFPLFCVFSTKKPSIARTMLREWQTSRMIGKGVVVIVIPNYCRLWGRFARPRHRYLSSSPSPQSYRVTSCAPIQPFPPQRIFSSPLSSPQVVSRSTHHYQCSSLKSGVVGLLLSLPVNAIFSLSATYSLSAYPSASRICVECKPLMRRISAAE